MPTKATHEQSTIEQDQVIKRHYRRLASNYTDFLTWSPEFIDRLTAKIVEKLRLEPGDSVLDLGCGTGMYSLAMLERVPLERPIVGVDPFEEMLAGIPEGAPIEPVAADALEFSARPGSFDKILIKETVHHIEDRAQLLHNLHERLTPGGILLLVHVNPELVEYPLWSEALERARWWLADPDELVRLLADAGFEVDRDLLAYRHSVPRKRYLKMARSGYMSFLTSFSDEEIRAGIAEVEERYGDEPLLEFTESFDYLTATKVS